MFKKSWVIVEVTEGSERQEFVTLAGTSDKRAINKVLAALKLYKDECLRDGREDLTLLRQSVVEDLSPVNQVLNQDNDEAQERLMSLVEIEESK
jgi:hypothetical protein